MISSNLNIGGNAPLRGLTRMTTPQPIETAQSGEATAIDSANLSATSEAPAISPQAALRTATVTALRTAALTLPGASYLLAPTEDAYRGRLDMEVQVKDLKDYAKKRLGEVPENMSLGQTLAYTGASSLTDLVKNKNKYGEKLGELKELGRDFQGAVLVREDQPNSSLVVMNDATTPEQTRVTSFQEAARNESARADIMALFNNPKWESQLQGSKLAEYRDQLSTPGTDVKATLSQAYSELEGGYTKAHSERAIDSIGRPLAEVAGLNAAEKAAVEEVRGLYDIGKLAVNQEILDFKGRWPEDKRGSWFGQVANHVSAELVDPLLKAFGVSDEGRQAVLHHHERPNGFAYNKENQAPAWTELSGAAKVVGMADTIDAMMHSKANHERPEERTLEPAEIQKRLQGDAESGRVDGALVELAFKHVVK